MLTDPVFLLFLAGVLVGVALALLAISVFDVTRAIRHILRSRQLKT